jgi:NADP-dependent alcohol dehydrogenase
VVDAYTRDGQYLTYPHEGYKTVLPKNLQTLLEVGPRSGRKPKDYALASNFMWSCTMALNGLIQGVP